MSLSEKVYKSLENLPQELTALETKVLDLYAKGDNQEASKVSKRISDLKPVVELFLECTNLKSEISYSKDELKGQEDQEMKAFFEEELGNAQSGLVEKEEELRLALLPKDQNEGRNVIVEIRGAEGGDEGNIWAGDLFRMYQQYCEIANIKLEILEMQAAEAGGYKEIVFSVRGPQAWTNFKFEGGPHRVQRVPATESQGRVHTSSATVVVLPEAEEVDVEIVASDVKIDVYRSSGPGGQSVNTTDSAVRLTHLPTGVVVTCQDEKSQLQNKEKAFRILRSRLLQHEQEKQAEAESSTRLSQVKSGGRSEKIRTYNYKDNRITDHRIGLTLYNLDRVLDGDLGQVIEALKQDERARQLSQQADEL
jgi:peptide chain release factor 1